MQVVGKNDGKSIGYAGAGLICVLSPTPLYHETKEAKLTKGKTRKLY